MTQQLDSKKVIGFDLDGVFLDFSGLKKAVAEKQGIEILIEETPSDIFRNKIGQERYADVQKEIYADRSYATQIPMVFGAKEGIEHIKSKNVPFFLVSRRKHPEVAIDTLKAHSLWPDFFNEENAFFVITPEDKNTHAVRLGITHYVDDEPSVLRAIHSVPNRILFDPFSVYPDDASWKRLSSWEDVIAQLLS